MAELLGMAIGAFVFTLLLLHAGYLAGRGAAQHRPPCTWTNDPIDGGWGTTCNRRWLLVVGTPTDNYMHFCPFCGRKIEVKEAKP